MIRIIRAIRPALPVMAAVMFLFIASALAVPQQAEAQMDCAGCMYAGDDPGHFHEMDGVGVGQPGYGWDCGSQPEGATECSTGATYDAVASQWISWCETGGGMCQSLMFLDFTEDGMASWGTAVDEEPAASTCDGVLLRGPVPDDSPSGYDAALTLVL